MPNTPLASGEPRWKSYLKAMGFLLPALVLWALASLFFAPKLQELWLRGGGPASEARWVMDLVMFLVQEGRLILGGVLGLVLLMELRPTQWARYRRLGLGSAVWLLNSAVVVGLWFMCLAAIYIAPALR